MSKSVYEHNDTLSVICSMSIRPAIFSCYFSGDTQHISRLSRIQEFDEQIWGKLET